MCELEWKREREEKERWKNFHGRIKFEKLFNLNLMKNRFLFYSAFLSIFTLFGCCCCFLCSLVEFQVENGDAFSKELLYFVYCSCVHLLKWCIGSFLFLSCRKVRPFFIEYLFLVLEGGGKGRFCGMAANSNNKFKIIDFPL